MNYGTCLQSYATFEILKRNADVIFLDRRIYFSLFKFSFLLKKIFNLLFTRIKKKKKLVPCEFENANLRKMQKINEFCIKTYSVKSICTYKDIIEIDKWADCYLIGSDQMWNPWMVQPQYLLDFVPKKSKKAKIAYAASFGVDNIPDSKKYIYTMYLPHFSKITVREPRAAELVKELSQREATVVLDPTFLLLQEDWKRFCTYSNICSQYKLKSDYIVCYFIGSQEFNHIAIVREIAKLLELKLVIVPMKMMDYKENDAIIIADACHYDFVSLIDNAALVCTDSFHAVVFSFLMNTPFYNFPRFKKGDKYSQDARLQNIMTKFGLEGSYWNDKLDSSDIKEHLKCDYTYGYSVLEVERKRSLDILWDMIGEDNGTSD